MSRGRARAPRQRARARTFPLCKLTTFTHPPIFRADWADWEFIVFLWIFFMLITLALAVLSCTFSIIGFCNM